MTSQEYEQTRSCEKCGYTETRFLDELTAAFEQTRLWEEPCSQCGSTDFSKGSCSMPLHTRTQFQMWATNAKLSFLSQDEDIILASPENLELLLEFLDYPSTHIAKRRVLASALYILWYDAQPEIGRGYPNSVELANKVAQEINKRTSLLIELGELGVEKSEDFSEPLWYISDYLREAFEKHKSST
jgi:hypothetical protein